MEMVVRVAAAVGIAALWFGLAWALPPLGYIAAIVHGVLAMLDMMMNGPAYAEFVPFNLAGAALAGSGAYFGTV